MARANESKAGVNESKATVRGIEPLSAGARAGRRGLSGLERRLVIKGATEKAALGRGLSAGKNFLSPIIRIPSRGGNSARNPAVFWRVSPVF